jgi:adenosylmethionine-8-amino-7-oxononanoate aminotransferase
MGAVCRKHGALIIFDEIMCGFGRTGRLHAWERDGFAPDIQVLGKGLGAGEQVIAAVLCNKRIENTIRDGSGQFAHGFTFQNNALACTAGHEVLRIIRDDRLLDNVNRLAPVLMSGLVEELGNHPNVGDIRGEGFFVGVSHSYPFEAL